MENTSQPNKQGKLKRFLLDYITPCFVGLILALFLNKFVMCTAFVPSGSMEPTIMTDEKMLVLYNHSPNSLNRGDIVVFESKEYGKFFVKRLIAKGGDQVEIHLGGGVSVNGERLVEDYVKNEDVFQVPQTFQVPDGKLFFLGDNRSNSADSRYWGQPFISEEDVLGTPIFVYSPLSEMRWLK